MFNFRTTKYGVYLGSVGMKLLRSKDYEGREKTHELCCAVSKPCNLNKARMKFLGDGNPRGKQGYLGALRTGTDMIMQR